MSPEQIRENDLKALAEHTLAALGVNGRGDAAHILEHAIAQACLELHLVEDVLDADTGTEPVCSVELACIIEGIRTRLSLVQNNAAFLASLLPPKKSEAAE